MLQVKTYLDKSNIQGIGLFAAENIKKGTITWKFNPRVDIYFDPKELIKFPKLLKKQILTYAVLSTQTGKYVLCCDDARFANHSSKPNIEPFAMKGEVELPTQAIRNIKKGEELTLNYKHIDKKDAKKNTGYLKD